MDIKKNYKLFKKKFKENDYLNWEEVTKQELLIMDEHELINLFRKYQIINLKSAHIEKDSINISHLSLIVSTYGTMTVVLGSIFIAWYNFFKDFELSIAEMIENPTEMLLTGIESGNEMMELLVYGVTVIVVIILLYILVSWILSHINSDSKIDRIVYHEELIRIIRNVISKRNIILD